MKANLSPSKRGTDPIKAAARAEKIGASWANPEIRAARIAGIKAAWAARRRR